MLVINEKHLKIIPKCSHMDPPIIDLQLGQMDTV